MNIRTVITLGIAAIATVTSSSAAQGRFLTNASFGASPRLGSLPGNVEALGGNWGGHFMGGYRIGSSVFATVVVDASMQQMDLPDAPSNASGTYAFHTYTIAAGPTLLRRRTDRVFMLAGAYPTYVMSFWGAASLDACRTRCFVGEIRPRDKQTQGTFGALLSFGLAYQFVEAGRVSERPWALGLQGRMIAAPSHRDSGIPVAQWGVYLLLVGGEP